MSRKTVVRKRRQHTLEPRYQNPLLSKFIRMMMMHGKLSISTDIVYSALDLLGKKGEEEQKGIDVFIQALTNVKPLVRVKARRVGGSTYQVPTEVPEELGWTFAMRWIINIARKKSGKAMKDRLVDELFAASEKRGDAYRKREETHKMADANRAYAHFKS